MLVTRGSYQRRGIEVIVPAKTLHDLSVDQFAWTHWRLNGRGDPFYLEIRVITGTNWLSYDGSIALQISSGQWMVEVSEAESGWGPLIYDIAMEIATENGAGLRSHDTNVSSEAARVWEFYFRHRPEIEKVEVPSSIERDVFKMEALNYSYYKSPAVIVSGIKELGKWHSTSEWYE